MRRISCDGQPPVMAANMGAIGMGSTTTNTANTWPTTCCHCAENATRLMFTALSISSIDMKITMMLRRVSTPISPMVNRAAASSA